MKKNVKSLVVLIMGVIFTTPSLAFDVLAAHPNKPEIVLCGNNQVLYVVNTEDFSVKKRVSLNFSSDSFDELISYSTDGKYLVFNTFMEDLKYFETENYTITKTVELLSESFVSLDKSKIISLDSDDGIIKIFDFNTGNQIQQLSFDNIKYGEFMGATMNVEKNQIMIWKKNKESKEEKISYTYDELKSLTPSEKVKKEAMNDGKSSYYFTIDLATKEISEMKETWMSGMSDIKIYPYGDNYLYVGDEEAFVMNTSGEISILPNSDRIDNAYFYVEKNLLILLHSRDIEIINVETEELKQFSISNSMSFNRGLDFSNNWVYFSTTDYRVKGVSLDGGMKNTMHIY